MTLTAVPWFVLQTTGSATKTGITAFFDLIPVVVVSFIGGALVDRMGYQRTSVLADLSSCFAVALIPLLYLLDHLSFSTLLILVFIGGLLDPPGDSARSALIPEAARNAGWSLERATGANAAIERGARLAGAPIAGLLIAAAGATNVLWIDALTFGFSAIVISSAIPRTHRVAPGPSARYIEELKEGIAFLWQDAALKAMILTVTATNFLDAWFTVLLPVYARAVYGSAISLGLLYGAMGGGSLVGALLFAGRGRKLSRRTLFAVCFMTVTIRYPFLAVFPPEGVALSAMLVAGVAAGPINPIIDTISYERVPKGMRGRVLGISRSLAWMAMPLGVLSAGIVLDRLGLRVTLLALGCAYVATTATIWLSRGIRGLDPRPETSILPSAVTSAR
jgi:predicted MFS family arabinose efflux permease